MKLPIVHYNHLDEYFGKQSCMVEHIPLLPKCLDWQWALETLDTTTQRNNKRVNALPNGGFVVNSPCVDTDYIPLNPNPFVFFERKLKPYKQVGQVIRNQVYIALSVKSSLFSKHTDTGQNSFVWQCQGKTAVEVGDAYGVLEPGDVLYLHNETPHCFTSMGPRFSITFSLENE
jgi:hypothetical protein|tara:strand:+ start:2806 stop:3327 length:522 start_codon:yes stop_codon:yes gene_type:complete